MATIPSIAMIPSGYKAGKVYSVLPTNGDADLTFTRASLATRVDETGLIETMATGVPRLDYSGGGCPFLLLEPQSTNLVTYSEDFSNAVWQKQRLTISSNNTTAPNGNLTADKIIATIDNNTHRLVPPIFNATVGVPITYSFFAKSAEYNEVQVFDGRFTGNVIFTFNLNTGVVTNGFAQPTLQASAKVVNLVNGWKRISVTVIPTETVTTSSLFIVQLSINNVSTFAGDGTSGIYFWGAQLEALPYATSYIPTVASTVTRVLESASKTGLSSFINSLEGTFYADLTFDFKQSNLGQALSLSNGTTSQRITFGKSTGSNSPLFLGLTNSDISFSNTSVSMPSDSKVKLACAWGLNFFKFYVNGVLVINNTATQAFASGVLDRIRFDSPFAGTDFNGRIKAIKVYNTALSNSELATLTTQ